MFFCFQCKSFSNNFSFFFEHYKADSMVRFLANSDLHYRQVPRDEKHHHIGEMLTLMRNHTPQNKIEAVILAGDLTAQGVSYDHSLGGCYCIKKHDDELKHLRKECLEPMEQYTTVLPCAGNHDTYNHGRAKTWLNKKYGKNKQRTIGGISFISCGIYPDAKALKFLRGLSDEIKAMPTVFYWHYPPIGPHHDWWSDIEIAAAFETLKQFKDVKGLFCGHAHGSYYMRWRETFDLYVVGGPTFADVVCTKDDMNVRWFNKFNEHRQVERYDY